MIRRLVTDEEERLTPPEEEEPEIAALCAECKEPIFKGQIYGEENATGRTVCAYCLEDAWEYGYTVREKFEMLGYEMKQG